MCKPRDLAGQRFGLLTAIEKATPRGRQTYWLCQCDCGATTSVFLGNLTSGTTKSCGCASAALVAEAKFRHKHSRSSTLGTKTSPEYTSWQKMRARCLNPKNHVYRFYGGRGIAICSRWDIFENFLSDMGLRPSPKHTLDRIDPNGNYGPDNCRWADAKTQARNRRDVRQFEIDGEVLCLPDLAKKYGIAYGTLWDRIKHGWDIERAVSTPTSRPNTPEAK